MARYVTSTLLCGLYGRENGTAEQVEAVVARASAAGRIGGVSLSYWGRNVGDRSVREALATNTGRIVAAIARLGIANAETAPSFHEVDAVEVGCPDASVATVVEFVHEIR
jgi:hypothetical protein